MSKFEISKARLTQIIKEEYQSLNEDNALTRTIHRWAEEAKSIPPHLTVARMVDAGDFDGALEMLEAMKAQAEFQAMQSPGMEQSPGMAERLTPDQLEIDEELLAKQKKENLEEAHCTPGTRDDEEEDEGKRSVEMGADDNPEETKMDHLPAKVLKKIAKKKKLKKEAVDSIRELIKQELKSL
jgi:hypothetical protein|tara:strand:+ start:230 stop:778 length:549 start_codon:yes stop_codon:yes gene_type:complete